MQTSDRGKRVQRLRGKARERAVREVLARWDGSELSKAAFCRREGIASVSLTRWLREFGSGSGRRRRPRSAFVEVRPAEVRRVMGFEVALPSGVTLRVPAGFDGADLSRLLLALRATC
jgi:transposase-like protein